MAASGGVYRKGFMFLRRHGIRATGRATGVYVSQRLLGVQPDFTQHRYLLGQHLSKTFEHTVHYGPFAGMHLIQDSWWSAGDRGGMLLGLYEREVLEVIDSWRGRFTVFIDVGAADGYYAVGCLVGGLADQAVCFEVNEAGQNVIAAQSALNGVSDAVHVFGEAGKDFLSVAREVFSFSNTEALLLIDIEGGEYDLLDESTLASASGSRLIVEMHGDPTPPGSQTALKHAPLDSSRHGSLRRLHVIRMNLLNFKTGPMMIVGFFALKAAPP